ncbi:LysR family transcriptional regulator YeiE [Rhodovulum sp. PH10]|uniref:LysR family transcriptional regulator n=1 Tax=Rhodovulum sp. PH10 TaxID=1187851 RepID=UPI00027C1E55|nr:LysR family transcriptional regulator [Rhodovulum sp. PH10]EJW11473.1 LysR family transcriptional regulator YeiE [Rhodovulum sp. PH10]
MTLDQLRVFVAVAEKLHVTKAAAALAMTQSAASAAVQALESRLGARLFDRVGRGIALTEAGRVLLPEAKAVLVQADRAERALAELQGLSRGTLAVSASQTIAAYWLPRHLARFHAAHPGIGLSLSIGNTAEVARAVAHGEADLGFVEGDVDDPLLVTVPVGADRLVLVVASGHPFAGRREMAPADLLRLDWVLRERGSGTRQVFEDALRGFGLDPTELSVALELPSNESVRSAVEAGAGATVISRLVAEAGIAAGTLAVLPVAFPERAFAALRHGDHWRSRAETAFLELIARCRETSA